MYIDETKKVLLVMGMEQDLDGIRLPENSTILQTSELERIKPFNDLMRDIILAVYQHNIEEIFVVAANENRENREDILKLLDENKDLQEKIKTLDSLYIPYTPGFTDRSIREWMEGSPELIKDLYQTAEVIRRHPLMPSSVKVRELWLDQKRTQLFEQDVC
jgi:carbonic anhydrase